MILLDIKIKNNWLNGYLDSLYRSNTKDDFINVLMKKEKSYLVTVPTYDRITLTHDSLENVLFFYRAKELVPFLDSTLKKININKLNNMIVNIIKDSNLNKNDFNISLNLVRNNTQYQELFDLVNKFLK